MDKPWMIKFSSFKEGVPVSTIQILPTDVRERIIANGASERYEKEYPKPRFFPRRWREDRYQSVLAQVRASRSSHDIPPSMWEGMKEILGEQDFQYPFVTFNRLSVSDEFRACVLEMSSIKLVVVEELFLDRFLELFRKEVEEEAQKLLLMNEEFQEQVASCTSIQEICDLCDQGYGSILGGQLSGPFFNWESRRIAEERYKYIGTELNQAIIESYEKMS